MDSGNKNHVGKKLLFTPGKIDNCKFTSIINTNTNSPEQTAKNKIKLSVKLYDKRKTIDAINDIANEVEEIKKKYQEESGQKMDIVESLDNGIKGNEKSRLCVERNSAVDRTDLEESLGLVNSTMKSESSVEIQQIKSSIVHNNDMANISDIPLVYRIDKMRPAENMKRKNKCKTEKMKRKGVVKIKHKKPEQIKDLMVSLIEEIKDPEVPINTTSFYTKEKLVTNDPANNDDMDLRVSTEKHSKHIEKPDTTISSLINLSDMPLVLRVNHTKQNEKPGNIMKKPKRKKRREADQKIKNKDLEEKNDANTGIDIFNERNKKSVPNSTTTINKDDSECIGTLDRVNCSPNKQNEVANISNVPLALRMNNNDDCRDLCSLKSAVETVSGKKKGKKRKKEGVDIKHQLKIQKQADVNQINMLANISEDNKICTNLEIPEKKVNKKKPIYSQSDIEEAEVGSSKVELKEDCISNNSIIRCKQLMNRKVINSHQKMTGKYLKKMKLNDNKEEDGNIHKENLKINTNDVQQVNEKFLPNNVQNNHNIKEQKKIKTASILNVKDRAKRNNASEKEHSYIDQLKEQLLIKAANEFKSPLPRKKLKIMILEMRKKRKRDNEHQGIANIQPLPTSVTKEETHIAELTTQTKSLKNSIATEERQRENTSTKKNIDKIKNQLLTEALKDLKLPSHSQIVKKAAPDVVNRKKKPINISKQPLCNEQQPTEQNTISETVNIDVSTENVEEQNMRGKKKKVKNKVTLDNCKKIMKKKQTSNSNVDQIRKKLLLQAISYKKNK